MKFYEKPLWSVKQIVRETGLVEDICEHGIGHPNKEWLKLHDKNDENYSSVHGCDGCCLKIHKLFICNMREECSITTCEHYNEHPHSSDCEFPPSCNINQDAKCIEVKINIVKGINYGNNRS